HAQFRIHGRRVPYRRPTPLPDVGILRPGVVAELAGAGDGVEAPQLLAGFRVEGAYPAARAEVAAGVAGDDHALEVQRCRRQTVAEARFAGLRFPQDFAGALVERHQHGVEATNEDLAFTQAHTTAHPAAADEGVGVIQAAAVLPEDVTALDTDREHVVLP